MNTSPELRHIDQHTASFDTPEDALAWVTAVVKIENDHNGQDTRVNEALMVNIAYVPGDHGPTPGLPWVASVEVQWYG